MEATGTLCIDSTPQGNRFASPRRMREHQVDAVVTIWIPPKIAEFAEPYQLNSSCWQNRFPSLLSVDPVIAANQFLSILLLVSPASSILGVDSYLLKNAVLFLSC